MAGLIETVNGNSSVTPLFGCGSWGKAAARFAIQKHKNASTDATELSSDQ